MDHSGTLTGDSSSLWFSLSSAGSDSQPAFANSDTYGASLENVSGLVSQIAGTDLGVHFSPYHTRSGRLFRGSMQSQAHGQKTVEFWLADDFATFVGHAFDISGRSSPFGAFRISCAATEAVRPPPSTQASSARETQTSTPSDETISSTPTSEASLIDFGPISQPSTSSPMVSERPASIVQPHRRSSRRRHRHRH